MGAHDGRSKRRDHHLADHRPHRRVLCPADHRRGGQRLRAFVPINALPLSQPAGHRGIFCHPHASIPHRLWPRPIRWHQLPSRRGPLLPQRQRSPHPQRRRRDHRNRSRGQTVPQARGVPHDQAGCRFQRSDVRQVHPQRDRVRPGRPRLQRHPEWNRSLPGRHH